MEHADKCFLAFFCSHSNILAKPHKVICKQQQTFGNNKKTMWCSLQDRFSVPAGALSVLPELLHFFRLFGVLKENLLLSAKTHMVHLHHSSLVLLFICVESPGHLGRCKYEMWKQSEKIEHVTDLGVGSVEVNSSTNQMYMCISRGPESLELPGKMACFFC